MSETGSSSQNAASPVDPTDHLPLSLLRSEAIPAAPDRSNSSIDWLPDFAGYSWVAYGSSSLLVITHFPSPLSQEETSMGPIFRQVFELSADPVTAVSWSLVTPSIGELAASSGNCIFVFSHDSANSNGKGSFCWSQNAVLEQCTNVQAIEWAASGDGIVSGGIEVVLWKRRNKSWEIAWKFKPELPQNLVSATWSIEGPSATAAYWKESQIEESSELTKCVFVCYGDGSSGYAKVVLRHPQPISMVQWRPSTETQSFRDAKHPPRHILLTCCLDGTARLWCEIDGGRVKKVGKDSATDRKSIRRSFCVAAVIEINQALNGFLGADISLTWAIEIGGIIKNSEGTNQIFTMGGCKRDMAGRCEWLIGVGPGMLVTFWAIHCLEDISPMRFPRVTLWKRQEEKSLEVGLSNLKGLLLLKKAFIMRNCLSAPPTLCSLLQLLPCNSLSWSFLYTKKSNDAADASLNESRAENFLSHSVHGVLNMDGHTGKILQVSVHPYIGEVQLAVSLDSNGLLLFWSLSSISNSVLGLPTLIPTWKICGKLATDGSCSKYTSLSWAPSVLHEDRVLLMGHSGGIDCFIVKISKGEENDVTCHYVCTMPFTGQGPCEDGPAEIYSIPLSSSCKETFTYNRFMLLGIWIREFKALSWEINIHSYDLGGSCCKCNFNDNAAVENSTLKFEDEFSGRKYCFRVDPLSLQFPEPHNNNHVTSFSVICPGGLTPVQQKLALNGDLCSKSPAYIMATGCSDGSLKLWRCNCSKLSTSHSQWELVGVFVADQGPVSAICLTSCGRKIATITKDGQSSSNAVSTLCIWDSIHLVDSGSFMLEDTLSLNKDVVALNWLALGNGQLALGVCLKTEFRIYAPRRFSRQSLFNSKNSLETHIWYCIAVGHTSPDINHFLWGPGAAAVAVHACYLNIFSPWIFLLDKKCQTKSYPHQFKENLLECERGIGGAQLKCQSDLILGFWSMIDIAGMLMGSLPDYHPEALFTNIYSGNWKRAYASLRHLVEYLTSNCASIRRDCSSKASYAVPQILLSDYFDGLLFKSSNENEFQWSGSAALMTSSSQFQSGLKQFAYNSAPNASSNIFGSSSKPELGNFFEPLEKLHELAAITNTQKMQILAIIDLLNEVCNPHSSSAYGNLDEPGRRFWVTIRFQQLHFSRMFGNSASLEELVIDSELISWAFHSDCQESLFDSVLPSEPTWQEMQTLGVAFWFTNAVQLRTRMEKLARLQYLKRKDPKDCTLLYVALNRLQVLASLFKISKDEKDKPLVGFLSRNFQEEKNKAAALKNAYVLMGRHQLELAIAFFLLGGDASSAVTVCAKNLGDEQLALVICRLVEGRGGPLERHLITKFILPSAIERRDYWLASLLEWELGNYFQSYLTIFGFQDGSANVTTTLSCKHVAFKDPSIGLYCLTLANKNSMRNAMGDQNAAVLAKWASLMNAAALSRCGLPLEALECLSSSQSILKGTDQENASDIGCSKILQGILKPSVSDSSNWLLDDVASNLESHAKLDLALQYISKLVREHPSWPDSYVGSDGTRTSYEDDEIHQYEKLLKNFQYKLCIGLAQFEQKFSLVSLSLINMVLVSLCNNGLWFLGYDILYGYLSQGQSQHENHTIDTSLLYPLLHKPLLRAAEDISFLFSHFIAACAITCSTSNSSNFENDLSGEVCSKWLKAWDYYFQGVKHSLWGLRAAIKIFSGMFKEGSIPKLMTILDLYEYYAHYASAWLQRNSKGLILMTQPLFITFSNGHTPYEVDMLNMKKLLHHVSDVMFQNRLTEDVGNQLKVFAVEHGGEVSHSIPEDERCLIMGACLWQHMSLFMKHKLSCLDENYTYDLLHGKHSAWAPFSTTSESDSNIIAEKLRLLSWIMAVVLKAALQHISSYHIKQLALLLQQKVENGFDPRTLLWLEEARPSPGAIYQHLSQGIVNEDTTNNTDEGSISKILWDTCADPNMISESFVQEKINWSSYFPLKPSKGWSDVYKSTMGEHENDDCYKNEGRLNNSSASSELGSPSGSVFQNGHTSVSSWQKDSNIEKEISLFHNPKEVYKRNGELFEALCVNSIDQRQTALASNRKGIIFFNWEDYMPFGDQSDYIWPDADWPHNGWAGCESTPVPTRVSLGIGLGTKKGAHLGLGGATVGVGSVARPGRDLTGGGAFGVPGYAGTGASGLGWEIQEDFDEFVDPPATVENISTRAFSSHPSRPFFLVGSINTHIYLWEFGKDKATATYGVLPAPNVPPPYVLASISAVQFDQCGHRFATAALDGTVCTWQLEVGGRSNIRPTESSLCFNSHVLDVTYVTASGSVIAAAGCSSNGVNVVMWDTLAPPATSRASIICHDGGARSISVFDNDIGSGSVSPIIVTGGKNGDVGLHDFRYIATGRTNRHRYRNSSEPRSNTSNADTRNQISDQNLNGMLWYIPNAHSGSITKISTIPNTSLFLTGSKDGDVKLWDAKTAKMVHHWSKLHDRHTFLQPSSSGFGGIVRAAVTDIQLISHGFLSCGGDGSVKLVQLKDHLH